MRIAIAAVLLTASTSLAAADFYVVQNLQTGKCAIEQEMPETSSAQILLNTIGRIAHNAKR